MPTLSSAMQRRVEKALVAKVGTFVFAGILGMPATLPASGAQPVTIYANAATTSVAVGAFAYFEIPAELADIRPVDRSSPSARSAADATTGNGAAAHADSPTPTEQSRAVVAPRQVAVPQAAPGGGSLVLASWYGPGFYGDRTACGAALTQEILGVANLSLPCGTMVTLTSPAGRTVTVPVIDRGPYVAGRTIDLTYATKVALSCSDLCTVKMAVP